MISLLFIVVLSLFASPIVGDYLSMTMYSQGGACSGTPTATTVYQCNACINMNSISIRTSCSGGGASLSTCTDANCGTCPINAPIPSQCVAGAQYAVSSSFPNFSPESYVTAFHSSSSCSSSAVYWQTAGATTCAMSDLSCINSTGTTISSGCWKDFPTPSSPPSSSGTSSGSPTNSPPAPTVAPPNCEIQEGKCTFYQECVQRSVPCDLTDYAINFGLKYCNSYMNHLNQFSAEGQQWVKNTLECLQESLKTIVTSTSPRPTCDSVRAAGFASNPACYLNGTSSCFLPKDWSIVMGIVGKALLTSEGFDQFSSSTSDCLKQYSLSSLFKLTNVTLSASTTLSSFLQQLSDLIGVPSSSISIIDSSSSLFNYFGSQQRKREDTTSSDVTFVFYAESADQIVTKNAEVTNVLKAQTTWPSASVTVCATSSADECKASNDVIGPSPSGTGGSTPIPPASGASTVLSSLFATLFIALVATL